MPIEKDIKIIRKTQTISRAKTVQEIKNLAKRQTVHEKQLKEITTAISLLPTQDVITKTIQDTIKIVVNGKIDHLTEDVATGNKKIDMLSEHLKQQDITQETASNSIGELKEGQELQANAIQELTDKVTPIDKARVFSTEFVKVVVYVGTVAGSLAAIIGFLYLVGWIKQ